jgi:hypothetical protein
MKKGFALIVLAALLIVAGMIIVWLDTGELKAAVSSPFSGIASALVENDPNVWAIFATLLVCEVLGALASFYVIQKAFRPDARTVLLAFIVALVNFGTLYGQYANVTRVGPVHFLAFFKDGFFWFATLPALARVLGIDANNTK